MEWQLVLVALAVLGAAGYLARQMWPARRGKCGGGCCAKGEAAPAEQGTALITGDELTARAREGRSSRRRIT